MGGRSRPMRVGGVGLLVWGEWAYGVWVHGGGRSGPTGARGEGLRRWAGTGPSGPATRSLHRGNLLTLMGAALSAGAAPSV